MFSNSENPDNATAPSGDLSGLDDLQLDMDYEQIMHYFDNLKVSDWLIKKKILNCLLKESNAWVEEIIAKIRDILLSFSEQYRVSALNGNISPNHVMNINQSFDYFFDHLSESYA